MLVCHATSTIVLKMHAINGAVDRTLGLNFIINLHYLRERIQGKDDNELSQ